MASCGMSGQHAASLMGPAISTNCGSQEDVAETIRTGRIEIVIREVQLETAAKRANRERMSMGLPFEMDLPAIG